MTCLDLLRSLAAAGVGLEHRGDRLRATRTRALAPDIRAALTAHKAALLVLLADDDAVIRAAFGFPAVALTPVLRVVLLRLAGERDAFTPSERTRSGARAAELSRTGYVLWLAEAHAAEDVCRARTAIPHTGRGKDGAAA